MAKIELTNMVMIEDKKTGKVLVQNRIKSWKGLSFPGGHVEANESFYDSAVREVKEETGLDVSGLKPCGVIHWLNTDTQDRYLVFLYKTTEFCGEYLSASDEGENIWMTLEELEASQSDNGIQKYIPMFRENGYSEAYGPWNEREPEKIFYL